VVGGKLVQGHTISESSTTFLTLSTNEDEYRGALTSPEFSVDEISLLPRARRRRKIVNVRPVKRPLFHIVAVDSASPKQVVVVVSRSKALDAKTTDSLGTRRAQQHKNQ